MLARVSSIFCIILHFATTTSRFTSWRVSGLQSSLSEHYLNAKKIVRSDRPHVPLDPEQEVTLFCRSSLRQEEFQVLNITDRDAVKAWNKSRPLYFVIHGWTESAQRDWVQEMVDKLLTHINCNACAVDWSLLAASDILIAERYARLVGLMLARFIDNLLDNYYSASRISLIGHSLGARVSSDCGAALNGRLGVIYGE